MCHQDDKDDISAPLTRRVSRENPAESDVTEPVTPATAAAGSSLVNDTTPGTPPLPPG